MASHDRTNVLLRSFGAHEKRHEQGVTEHLDSQDCDLGCCMWILN
jgi:hypothetical protein